MIEDIVRKLSGAIPSGSGVDIRVVWTTLNKAEGRMYSEEARDELISQLVERRILRQHGTGDTRRFFRGDNFESVAGPSKVQPSAGVISPQQEIPERSLMPFLREWIERSHAYRLFPTASKADKVKIVDTSEGGGRVGLWSRPDFTLAALQTGRYSNIRQIELAGYELKKAGAADLTSVHEALAHKRWVHRAYLVLYAPPGFDDENMVMELKRECGRYGLGYVTFSRLNDITSFEEHLPAARESIPPQLTEEFIESRMAAVAQDLREWVGVD